MSVVSKTRRVIPRRSTQRLAAGLILGAVAGVMTAFLPATTFAAQNTGGNWPSRSCGCSTAGKCYIAHRNSGDSQCLPDSSAGNACTGVCSFTTHNPSSGGGFIMRYGLGFQGGQGAFSTAP